MPTLSSHGQMVMLGLVSIMLVPVQTASHDEKSHVMPCFNCIHLMNKMVPLMMYLASHDSNAGTNGVT